AVSLEALAIAAQHLAHPLLQVLALTLGGELASRNEQRWVADDPRLTVIHPDQAIERLEAVLPLGLRDVLARRLHVPGPADLRQFREEAVDVEARVPDVEVAPRGEVT